MDYQMEYGKAMVILDREDWPLLQKHLSADPERVIPALKTYLAAFEARKDAQTAFDTYIFDCTGPSDEVSEHMAEIGRLNKVWISANDTQEVTYKILIQLLEDTLK